MKRSIVLAIALLLPLSGLLAQEDPSDDTGRNELKVNAALLLAGFAEVTYEGIIGEDSGIGVSIGFAVDNTIDYRFNAIPYYRLYFGKKRAAGFFVEGNAAFFSERDFESDTEFGAGLGLAIGGKFINSDGWMAELFLGLGRNLVNNDDISEVYPRVGILIGKRF